MIVSRKSHHFHQLLSALAALILIVCTCQPSWAQATINVTTTQQGVTNGQCSLQEAIYATELKSNTAISQTSPDTFYNTGCTAGTGEGDIIVLPPGADFTFDHFWDGDGHNIYGPTATPIIFSKIIIEGNGATLRWIDTFRPGNSRLFAIGKADDPNFGSGTGDLTLRNVYIKNFHIKGGNGTSGGGGGLGAGGAIYNEGSLTIENSTFEQNGAVGGRGSGGLGGGGGGLSGNGGDGCTSSVSAGGGGGSRGNGGNAPPNQCAAGGGGGGGGGTVFAGADGQGAGFGGSGGNGGSNCGGKGGNAELLTDHDGRSATCPGGGGGGAGGNQNQLCGFFGSCSPEGGDGQFGGGGGGGIGDGGNGDFGGGGGAGYDAYFRIHGGTGGFGGGGGAAGNALFPQPGKGGAFAGHADNEHGGGGGALGGAVFNYGVLQVRNSTFFNNFVTRGESGGGSSARGADAGGAIFSMGKSLEVNDATFSGNQATGSGAAIVVYNAIVYVKTGQNWPFPPTVPVDTPIAFTLNNTIIANNGANECFFTGTGTVNTIGAGNLIMQNGSGTAPFKKCPGVVTTNDPQLQPLQLNSPVTTPTMAIPSNSPAVDQADASTSLSTDQRGVMRPQGAGFDIGAVEAILTTTWNPADKATNIILSNGNLTFTLGAGAAPIYNGVRSTASASSGKKYWELTANTIVSPANVIVEGMGNTSFDLNANHYVGSNLNGIGWGADGVVSVNGAAVANIQGWTQGDVLCFAVDLGSSKIWFRRNGGSWNNNAANDPATNVGGIDISNLAGGPYFALGQGLAGDTLTANFGASAYAYPTPSGFSNW